MEAMTSSTTDYHKRNKQNKRNIRMDHPMGLKDGFRISHTLHLPSIQAGSETNYRFAGVFHALNQRRARLCC
jgi:hypothetical protein